MESRGQPTRAVCAVRFLLREHLELGMKRCASTRAVAASFAIAATLVAAFALSTGGATTRSQAAISPRASGAGDEAVRINSGGRRVVCDRGHPGRCVCVVDWRCYDEITSGELSGEGARRGQGEGGGTRGGCRRSR